MVLSEIAFGVCFFLLLACYAALAAAQQKGDRPQVRVLHLFRAGLSLSALSYLFRLMGAPAHSPFAFYSFAACLLGTMFLSLGWREHWKLRNERRERRLAPRDEEDAPGLEATPSPFLAAGSSPVTARVHQALLHAQSEALRREECCVDTDHLLLGMLCDSGCAGVRILDALGAGPEKVHLELLGRMAPRRRFTKQTGAPPVAARPTGAGPLALTDRAEQALALAELEAHRFDKTSVGTEHLLLGLALAGKGRAAAVLFGEGVTVDGIRLEILKARKSV